MKEAFRKTIYTASRYFIWCAVAILFVLALSLPWVKLNGGVRQGFFALIRSGAGSQSAHLKYIVAVNIIGAITLLGGLIFYIIDEFVFKRHNYIVNKIFGILFVAEAYLYLGTLLCYRFGFVNSGLDTEFMMNQLGFPFYAMLFCLLALGVKFFNRGKLAVSYIVLSFLCIVWLFPLLFIVFTSFRGTRGFYTDSFFPDSWSIDGYTRLFTDTTIFMFGKWFLNTLIVAVSTCILSTFIIVSVSFVLSRFRFKGKKTLVSAMLVLGMFPGFMSMIAIYYIIKGMGLSESLFALILCYSGGSAMGYYVVKGFIDTIPKDIDEAAEIDGASKLQIFFRVILPLAKPIVIYTVLTSFMSPWGDYIFASVIMGDSYESYTVALGLYMMLQNSYINSWYTSFAAGAVLVALPISILFIALNKYYVEGLSGSVKG